MDRQLLRRFLSVYPFQPATAVWRASEVAELSRVKFPVGFKVMPHWHGEERTFVVLSGTLHMGVGETWDESRMKAYPAGSFVSEPPKLPHYAWAKDGEVILQITGIGPASTTAIATR